ncbi:MAG: gliding motility protein GldM [Bacteroidetes bacterium]|nr:gliding motility protein GldM [Bacteroidota bacterium]
MASGKESPRQKMIGMMYLVLTALLALNVSQQILKGFVAVDESIEKSKTILTENNEKIRLAFEEYVNQGNYEAKPYLLKALEAQKYTRLMNQYIDSVKTLVIKETEKMQKADTAHLRFMKSLDNFDAPTYMLIGSDETKPKATPYSARDLRNKLTLLHGNLTSLVKDMQKYSETKIDDKELAALEQKLETIKPVDRDIVDDGVKMNWELENFYHMPLAAVVTNLDKIEADVKTIESEILHVLSGAATKSDVRINKLTAKVFAQSPYVQVGQAFQADILLAAGSTNISADRMKVLVGASYDSASHTLKNPGNAVDIKDGIGKYEITAGATGEQSLKGVVVYKNTKGVEEFYPFEYSYMVAAPFSAVAADNMNVFYVGVSNPLSVSAAGFAPSDLVVTPSGCGAKIKQVGAGKYELEATSSGTCMVTIAAKTRDGLKQQGPPKVFRVKTIPQPIGKLLNRFTLSTLEFTPSELAAIGGLGAESMGFQFPVNITVASYKVVVRTGSGTLNEFDIKGANLSPQAKEAIKNLKPGQRAWFEDVKVRMPGTTGLVPIPNITIKAKG